MNREDLELVLKKDFNINNEEIFAKLFKYFTLLIEQNSITNLTAITNIEDVYIKHFYDSLLISKSLDLNSRQTLLDVGSGAGFPGLLLKTVFPSLEVTLLEATKKKCNFLNLVIKELELKDIEVVNERAEEYILNKRESYDIVTARAVASLNELVELTIPYLKIGGLAVYPKGDRYQEEIDNSNNAMKVLKCKLIKHDMYQLPCEKGERNILLIQKDNRTNPIYPRKYSNIMKKPL